MLQTVISVRLRMFQFFFQGKMMKIACIIILFVYLHPVLFIKIEDMNNRVSFTLDDADKQAILTAIGVLNEKLLPRLTELSQGEARELPTMGDKSYGFVFKALEFAKQYPEFATFINVPEFEIDVNTIGLLREFYVPLSQLTKKVHDTMTLAGREAYVAGLTY